MMARWRRRWGRLALVGLVVLVSHLAAPQKAQAQFGLGFGFGFMDRPMSVENIYSRANMAGSYAYSTRQQNLTAPAPVRDLGFSMRNNVESRSELEARVATERRQRSQAQATPAPAPAVAPPTPVLPLAGFFDEYGKLVWPADSPVAGDLKAKRDTSDKATTTVMNEVKARGTAPLGMVTDARNLLLDYGRPALRIVRDKQTPVLAESFHVFLNALYESLGQAAQPPKR